LLKMTPKSPRPSRSHPLSPEGLRDLLKTAEVGDPDYFAQKQREIEDHKFLQNNAQLIYFAAVGADRKQLAVALHLSLRTIETYYGRLLDILDCVNTAHLVGKAFEKKYLVVEGGEIKINKEALL
jgi:DNA-binding NarL/FixJ family response regulator